MSDRTIDWELIVIVVGLIALVPVCFLVGVGGVTRTAEKESVYLHCIDPARVEDEVIFSGFINAMNWEVEYGHAYWRVKETGQHMAYASPTLMCAATQHKVGVKKP